MNFAEFIVKKKKRLFVDNIHKTSTFHGLLEFLKNTNLKKLHPSGLKLFKSKRSRHQAANIHLYPEEADRALTGGFWPRGVTCDVWLTREEVIKRGNENKLHMHDHETFKGRDDTDDEYVPEYNNSYRKKQTNYSRRQRHQNRNDYPANNDYSDEDYYHNSHNRQKRLNDDNSYEKTRHADYYDDYN